MITGGIMLFILPRFPNFCHFTNSQVISHYFSRLQVYNSPTKAVFVLSPNCVSGRSSELCHFDFRTHNVRVWELKKGTSFWLKASLTFMWNQTYWYLSWLSCHILLVFTKATLWEQTYQKHLTNWYLVNFTKYLVNVHKIS